MFGFELDIMKFFEGIRTDLLVGIFEAITMLAEETLMIILIVALWFALDKKLAQRILFIVIGSMGINSIIKNFAKVPRPWTTGEVTCVRPETATGYSFPSGHTQNFTTWTMAVAFYCKRWWLTLTVSILSILVALSRIILGAHYPSDVVVAVVLGIGIAALGNYIFDRVQDKKKLYWALAAIMSVFAILFLIEPDPQYADFYKMYGMALGLAIAVPFEEKVAPITYDVPWWKKVIRILIGLVFAVAIKEGIKLLDIFEILRVSFLIGALRYFALVLFLGGLCPWVFKKCKL